MAAFTQASACIFDPGRNWLFSNGPFSLLTNSSPGIFPIIFYFFYFRGLTPRRDFFITLVEKGLRSLSYVSIRKFEFITVETDSADRPGEKGILVLEDEKEIRKLVITVLDTLGHTSF